MFYTSGRLGHSLGPLWSFKKLVKITFRVFVFGGIFWIRVDGDSFDIFIKSIVVQIVSPRLWKY